MKLFNNYSTAGLLGVGGGIVIVPVLYHLFTLLTLTSLRMFYGLLS